MMNKRVFFSYSHKDKQIAQRIYWDLVRSGVVVWRDQIDGEPDVNFKDEFLKKIDEADIFFLLDSHNYRNNSTWCLIEIERFFEYKKHKEQKKMLIGLLQPDGEWRHTYTTEIEHRFFELINLQIYFELYTIGIYDNDSIYGSSISKLIEYLGEKYSPWQNIPIEKDLLDELSNIRGSYVLSDNERESILSDFRIIRQRSQQNFKTVDIRMQLWIDDCEKFKLRMIFPYLYRAIWLLNNDSNERALIAFLDITKQFQSDPRGFRGLGVCQYNEGLFAESIQTFNNALMLSCKKENEKHLMMENEILYNMALARIELFDFPQALNDLQKALRINDNKGLATVDLALNIEFCMRMIPTAICHRISVLNKEISRNPFESELYIRKGNCYVEEGKWQLALINYLLGYDRDKTIRNGFAVLNCYCNIGKKDDFNALYEQITTKTPISEEDFYFLGYIYYLNGNMEIAQSLYFRSDTQIREYYT